MCHKKYGMLKKYNNLMSIKINLDSHYTFYRRKSPLILISLVQNTSFDSYFYKLINCTCSYSQTVNYCFRVVKKLSPCETMWLSEADS